MARRIMIGIASTEAAYCVPFYQEFTIGDNCDIKSLAKAMGLYGMHYRKFVFKTFPAGITWTEADKLMDPLWSKHKL